MAIQSLRLQAAAALTVSGLFLALPLCRAQDRDRDDDWDRDRNMYTRLAPGTVVPVRTMETIDVDRQDYRVYPGIVDQDVRGENGRLAIPRGAHAELIVRVARDNDLILDLESVTVNGQRYGVQSQPNRVESRPSLVGAIVGAVENGTVQGRAVRIPRDSVVSFRLETSLRMGVPDRGEDREGRHYHDYYRDDRDRDHDQH